MYVVCMYITCIINILVINRNPDYYTGHNALVKTYYFQYNLSDVVIAAFPVRL